MTSRRKPDILPDHEALEWPAGTYQIVRLSSEGVSRQDAIAHAMKKYPGATIGRCAVVRRQWIVRVRPQKGT